MRVKSEFPEYFMIDYKLVSDKSTISYKFNEFYTNILVESCQKDQHSQQKVIYRINNLKPKDSCGQDGISSSLLIQLKHMLTKPLTIIINQSLKSGIFPDKLKIAKVIPLYKKTTHLYWATIDRCIDPTCNLQIV